MPVFCATKFALRRAFLFWREIFEERSWMDDNEEKNVQTETAEEKVAEVETKEKTPEPDEKAEILKKLEGMEKAVSTLQSKADKSEQENIRLMREKQALEATIRGLRGEYGDDLDFTEKLDKHRQKSELETYREKEKAEAEAKKLEAETKRFVTQTMTDIASLGVDPKDPRLNDAVKKAGVIPGDLDGLRKALMSEAMNIARESLGKPKQDDTEVEGLKAEIANLKKAMGLGTDTYSSPQGGGTGKRFTRQDIANYDPSKKTVSQMKEDVDAMLDQMEKRR